jgi:hypothetical protein
MISSVTRLLIVPVPADAGTHATPVPAHTGNVAYIVDTVPRST